MSDLDKLRVSGVDGQVIFAATEMDKPQLANPEWLWHDKEAGAATYGRWQKLDTQAPYIRADLVLAALEAQAAQARNNALLDAAEEGYRVCAEDRHVSLGDAVRSAIRALVTK